MALESLQGSDVIGRVDVLDEPELLLVTRKHKMAERIVYMNSNFDLMFSTGLEEYVACSVVVV